jgi:hypothetical protein
MSWDPSSADFSTGAADFSSGNADFSSGNFGGGNDFGGKNNFGASSGSDQNGGYASKSRPAYGDRGDRPPRPEATEEQLAHRNYNWASNRARYEFNENAVDENGMAPRDSTLEAELFEENSDAQQTHLDFSKYEKIPVKIERGQGPQPIRSVSILIDYI